MCEERPIPGHPGYAATSDGRIISYRSGKRRELRPSCDARYGHRPIELGAGNRGYVHRLMLETFVGPCPPGMECRHLDGNPANNHIENLRWGTRKENIHDAMKHGTHYCKKQNGELSRFAKLKELDVRWIRYLRKAGIHVKDLAEVYGVSKGCIWDIVSRRTWYHIP